MPGFQIVGGTHQYRTQVFFFKVGEYQYRSKQYNKLIQDITILVQRFDIFFQKC